MKKRALVLSLLSAMLLAGCADRGVKDEIIVVSDKKVGESKQEIVVEEIVIEETQQEVPLTETLEDTVYEHAYGDVYTLYNDEYPMEVEMVFSISDDLNKDYRLHVYTKSKDEDGQAELLYTFPDVREGNVGIGRFECVYHIDQADLNDDEKMDVFVVGYYTTEEGLCYDTRVYLNNGKEYVLDEEYMEELNATYHLTGWFENDYPIMEILGYAEGDQNLEDIPEELRPIIGKWKLDGYKTDQEMQKLGTSWSYEYGTGGQYGAGAVLLTDGYFSYYVAIGIGGEGSYVYEDGLVTATAMPYERGTEEEILELYPKSEDGVEYLVLKIFDHEIYLIRED